MSVRLVYKTAAPSKKVLDYLNEAYNKTKVLPPNDAINNLLIVYTLNHLRKTARKMMKLPNVINVNLDEENYTLQVDFTTNEAAIEFFDKLSSQPNIKYRSIMKRSESHNSTTPMIV